MVRLVEVVRVVRELCAREGQSLGVTFDLATRTFRAAVERAREERPNTLTEGEGAASEGMDLDKVCWHNYIVLLLLSPA